MSLIAVLSNDRFGQRSFDTVSVSTEKLLVADTRVPHRIKIKRSPWEPGEQLHPNTLGAWHMASADFPKVDIPLVAGTSVGALLRERGTGAITQMRRTYRLARAAGYSPLEAFVAMFSDVDRKFLDLTEAEFNAWRDKVVESEPELAKQGSEAAGSPE